MTDWGGIPIEYRNSVVTGDACELSRRIPDGSVDLVFTDPIYDRIEDYEWLGREAARVLKEGGSLLVWFGTGYLPEVAAVLAVSSLTYGWQAIWYQSNGRSHVKSRLGHHHYAPLLWYRKADSRPVERLRDHVATSWETGGFNHGWSKHPQVIGYYLGGLTSPGDLVADFFCGGGTVPAVCKQLGRRYVAFEICPETAEKARQRIALTPMPLPFETPDPPLTFDFEEAAPCS